MAISQKRRQFLSLVTLMVATPITYALAGEKPKVTVWKDPNCGCCGKWVDHLRANGFDVTVNETALLSEIKTQHGVPADLAACHTATVGDYVIEGHVPAIAVLRLLDERPAIDGLAVPGMPAGSPGMEGNTAVAFEVIAFSKSQKTVFGRYKGQSAF
jgi:hypothetical protein